MRVALALLLAAGGARAWEGHLAADGQLQRWSFASGQPMAVSLITPPAGLPMKLQDSLRAAITQAAETWQSVDSAHVPVRYLGQIADRAPQAGEVLISLDVGPSFIGGHDTTGFTELTVQGHFITAARVHLNFGDFQWAADGSTNALDLQSVAAHEIGHALGLAHPCGDPDTNTPSCTTLPPAQFQLLSADVMYPSIAPGPRRVLTADDVAGVSTLLPVLAGPEPAPQLIAVTPKCLPQNDQVAAIFSENVKLTLAQPQGDLTGLELLQGDGVFGAVSLAHDGSGALVAVIPSQLLIYEAQLDARLVAQSGKAGVLFDALSVSSSCGAHGCSSSNASAIAILPLALLLFARRRGRALLLLLAFASAPAFAYKRSVNTGGLCTWWATRGHSFQIDAQGTPDVPGLAAFTAIRKSFLTWSAVTCSDLSFPDQGLSQDPKDRVVGYFPGQYNRNLVLFRTRRCGAVVPASDPCRTQGGCGNAYDCWDEFVHGDGVIATTTTTSNRFTGQINDSDIELNDSVATDGTKITFTAVDGPPCTDPTQTGCVAVDVQNTVTHESGHSIGLDHTPDPNATMYATAPEGEVSKRVLGADDIQAVCDIYPRGARTVTCADDPITLTESGSSDGGGCGCTHAQTGPGAALGALLLLLQMKRRSRRKPQLAISASRAPASAALPGSASES